MQQLFTNLQWRNKAFDLLNITFPSTWSSVIWTWPTATPKQRTFLSWNLIVERTSVILLLRSSLLETGVGNLPAGSKWDRGQQNDDKNVTPFERPGPSRRGICLMRASDARKASCFLASFLTSFLFLFNLYIIKIKMWIISIWNRRCTFSNRQRTCTPTLFAWHDRYQQHLQECKWTCEDGGH